MKRRTRPMSIGSDLESCKRDKHINKRPKKKKAGREIVKDYLVDFTENTNLHCLRYIGEKDRTVVEKVFWAFMFSCSLILCAVLIRKVYIRWDERPVIVSFDETTTPIWRIPYPAITICFETVIRQSEYNYTHYYHMITHRKTDNLTKEELRKFRDVSRFCYIDISAVDDEHANMSDTIKTIKKMSSQIDEVLFCSWKGVYTICSSLFSPILTEEGLCYTFNMLGAEDIFRTENLNKDYSYLEFDKGTNNWTLENGYSPDTPLNTYPRRATGSGVSAGLSFSVKINKTDLDYVCNGPGVKIMFHDPSELPRPSQKFYQLPLSETVVYAIKPKVMTTSESLDPAFVASLRQCYFATQRYLRFFKYYTQDNCEIECLTNHTFARCGCVHFSMPHAPDMPVCGGWIKCLEKAQRELLDIEVYNVMSKESKMDTRNGTKISPRCECIPACTSIKYGAVASQATFDWKETYKAFKIKLDTDDQNVVVTSVATYFREAQFIKSRRSELYGKTDFLANCGGLLGLFLGFSILSVAEILYFCTLRPLCLLWKYRRASKVHSEKVNSTST